MLEAPTWGPGRKGRQGTGVWPGLSPLGAPSREQCHMAPQPELQGSSGDRSTENAQTLGWAAPLAIHSSLTLLILQPHQLPVQVPGEQWLLHQATPSPAFSPVPQVCRRLNSSTKWVRLCSQDVPTTTLLEQRQLRGGLL